MRGAHLLVPVAVALALLTASAAQADIAPVAKPDTPAKTVAPLAKPTSGAPQQPVKPPQQPVAQHQVQQQPVRHETVHTSTPPGTATHSTTPATVLASGGREQPSLGPVVPQVRSKPGASQISRLFPTHLAQVAHESLPNYDTWPSWVLGAFTLLASAEAFLLVRLARARRFQQDALQEVSDL